MGDFYVAYLFHAFFAFFLLLKELPLPGDVAAVAFGGDVFAVGGNFIGFRRVSRSLAQQFQGLLRIHYMEGQRPDFGKELPIL